MYFCDRLTYNTTGNKVVTGLGFQPKYLRFTLSKAGTTANLSTGFADGTAQYSHSIYQDASGSRTDSYTTRCINHKNRVGGSITDVMQGTLVSFNADGFTLNIAATDGTPIGVEAFS